MSENCKKTQCQQGAKKNFNKCLWKCSKNSMTSYVGQLRDHSSTMNQNQYHDLQNVGGGRTTHQCKEAQTEDIGFSGFSSSVGNSILSSHQQTPLKGFTSPNLSYLQDVQNNYQEPKSKKMSKDRKTSSCRCPKNETIVNKEIFGEDESKSAEENNGCISLQKWRELQDLRFGKDNYCPGVIEDAVTGKCNFNALVLSLMKQTFGFIPKNPGHFAPFSLLEIFYRRINNERSYVKFLLNSGTSNALSVIDSYFRQKPSTEINLAISDLLKVENSESLNDYANNTGSTVKVTKMASSLPCCLYAEAYLGCVEPKSKRKSVSSESGEE